MIKTINQNTVTVYEEKAAAHLEVSESGKDILLAHMSAFIFWNSLLIVRWYHNSAYNNIIDMYINVGKARLVH